uniref:Small integral membrane protein 22 n=1 Tax=Balaenoptera musculus TaxID=9771 RepID=A0A8C0DMQ6_BALMU
MASLTEDVEQELSATAQQVLGKLWSHQLFQSKWDTGAFIIFLVFLGVVALLLLVVCIHCCCCGCPKPLSRSRKKHSVGFDNLALEP